MSVRGFLTLSLGFFLLSGWAVLAGETAAGEPQLGRLFFTPAARAELERQKKLQSLSTSLFTSNEPLRLDGVVVRSSGRHTVWLNGQPHAENDPSAAIVVRVSPTDPARVRLSPIGETARDVKVGAFIERTIPAWPTSAQKTESVSNGNE